jgi:oxygen-independent coproporphyrinogen-3 oxidase
MEARIPGYVDALPIELDLRLKELGPLAPARLDTLYLGGGTPSLLEAAQVHRLLTSVQARIPLVDGAEITLEIDPGSADADRIRDFQDAGVNRVTVGVQTFEPRLFAELGRAHDVDDAMRTIEDVREAGFTNLNLDLMFGLPGQSPDDFARDLARAIALEPSHLSLYNLTVEPNTGYAGRRARGALELPAEDDQAAMYELAVEATRSAGLDRYEVSNFAREGSRSRHNSLHWSGGEYLGVGAGAHGFSPASRPPVRWWNLRSPRRWEREVRAGRLPEAGREALSRTQQLAETVMLGLRRVEGIDRAAFRRRFGVDPGLVLREGPGGDLIDGGWIVVDPRTVRLTDPGFLLADHLSERLLGRLDPPRMDG